MENNQTVHPVGWGDDLLSEFQAIAYQNELATFANAPQWQKALLDVATVFNKCSSYAINKVLKTDEPSAILLFLSANNQYLASARSVSAGHCLPAYPTGRATVEFALYGWYLSINEQATIHWNNKPIDKELRKKWNYEFSFSPLTKKLSEINDGLANWARYLHQTAIDFGAHPNKDALYSNMALEYDEYDKDRVSTIKIVTLHPLNLVSINAMKFTVETGMIAIRLFALSFPDGLKTLNLDQDIARLTENLHNLQLNTKFK
ncbi:hypothetical protein [Sulfuriferula nivalis]|uniref:Uncharacterized protein n=1 Tax=Sulfuriferula nivalis TaxID=2675298 RepID=A0A809S8N0_9PROT|nr:hypothetical protein [Sulfuriferula nivalis]BBP00332.1 hypothetical protein SFSGTM_10400 [Sulfuriferula nivalis]